MFLPVVQFVTSKPSDVGTLVRISVSSHELGFFRALLGTVVVPQ